MFPDDCRLVPCSVAITAPAAVTYTNGMVTFEVTVTGRTPDKVELLKNGSLLATLTPPYQHTWDTTAEAEATYEFAARAMQGPTVYSSEPRKVVVDRTPPHIVSHTPADGDRDVGVHAAMRVSFDEPVSLPSVPESVVSLTGTSGVALTPVVTLEDGGKTIAVAFQTQPTLPTDVTLQLRAGITDLAGNSPGVPGPWSWRMPIWQKLGQYVTQTTSFRAQECAFDVDALDRPIVAWNDTDGVGVARWTGSAWEQIGSGIHGPGSASYPVIALKASGDPVLAWSEDTNPDPNWLLERVFVKHKTASGWEYLGQNPIGPDGSSMSQPSLTIDASGGIWLGDREMVNGVYHAVVRKYDGTFYWPQQGGNLNRAEREAYGLKLVFDGSGTLWAAWTESAGFGGIDNYLVFDIFASKLVSGNWTAVGGVLNNNTNAPAHNVKLTTVPGGFPIVTWAERMGSLNFQAWYRVAYSSGWGSQLAAATNSFYLASAPSLAVASAGDLYASALGAPYVVYRKSPGQTAWAPVGTEEYRVDPSAYVSTAAGAGATIRTTASGEVLLLWVEGKGTTSSLYVKRLNR